MRETVTETARLTGVPTRTIRRWIGEQRITCEYEDGKLLVSPLEVSELQERRAGGRLRRLHREK